MSEADIQRQLRAVRRFERKHQYVRLVGIELEGLFVCHPQCSRDSWGDLSHHSECPLYDGFHHDGSVNVRSSAFPQGICGECVSPPLHLNGVESWVRAHYPALVNNTCGLHVHMSMRDRWYMALLDRDYYDHLIAALTAWGQTKHIRTGHAFWDRLKGHNNYCRPRWVPDQQCNEQDKSSARYAFINACWALHGTVEVRVLPAFKNPAMAISAVETVVKTTNEFLRTRRGQPIAAMAVDAPDLETRPSLPDALLADTVPSLR
jgi:hypothetical protein